MRRSAGCRHFSTVQRFGLTAAVCPPEAKIWFGEQEEEEAEISLICRMALRRDLLLRGDGVFPEIDFLWESQICFISSYFFRCRAAYFSVINIWVSTILTKKKKSVLMNGTGKRFDSEALNEYLFIHIGVCVMLISRLFWEVLHKFEERKGKKKKNSSHSDVLSSVHTATGLWLAAVCWTDALHGAGQELWEQKFFREQTGAARVRG